MDERLSAIPTPFAWPLLKIVTKQGNDAVISAFTDQIIPVDFDVHNVGTVSAVPLGWGDSTAFVIPPTLCL